MPTQTSPSSSPPPPSAPSQTITQPGPRATALKKIYTSALTSTLKSNSYPNFASCFPTPGKYCPTALEGVWRQLNTRLEEECQKDFDKILQERDVIRGLNMWDEKIEEARVRRDRAVEGEEPPPAMHLLSADELSAAHMNSYLVRTQMELDAKLGETQRKNLEVMEGIRRQREEIEGLVGDLEALVRDVEGAVNALEEGLGGGGDGSSDLRKMVWDTEQEVAATK